LKQRYKPKTKPKKDITSDSKIGDMMVIATFVSKSQENAHSGRTAAILNENNLSQSKKSMTIVGHGMSNIFSAITFCMKLTDITKYFTELMTDGEVADEIITPSATAKPANTPNNIMDSVALGHAKHRAFSRKYILQHFAQPQP
jgi:hypothetical protein